MTDPLKPTNYINIGGVKFNSNDVEQQQTVIKNGAIRYSVFLKNGVHLEYPKQKLNNQASAFVKEDVANIETWTNINNLAYGNIKGTDKSDVIVLNGSNSTQIDVSGDNDKLGDHVIIGDTLKDHYCGDNKRAEKFAPSQNNKILTGNNDSIHFDTKDSFADVEGKGITSEKSLKGIKTKD